MAAVTMVLVLLLAVVVSRMLARLSPIKVPLPILQILIGATLSAVIGFNVRLDPGVFFLVLIPPLLFLDGWRIPKSALVKDWRPIVTLAFGLVVFTMLGIGFFIHALIPGMPLSVAFAVAAILAPTDPVAVSAIAVGTPIPARLMHILEGEALFNDASGLVCFRFAVAAVLTGRFSLADASLSFLKLAAGGLVAGLIVAWGASLVYQWLTRWTGEEPGTPILISILVPFAAYLAAEDLQFSGIMAAAAAGISMHYADLIGHASAVTRIRRSAIWEMLQVALNGIIFVLLGEQFPHILANAPDIARAMGQGSPWWLVVYVIAICLALTVLRFAWVWASLEGARVLASLRGETRPRAPLRFLLTAALGGVKGAITLAGILTLPTVLADGAAFPARALAIFLAMGVILISLLVASVGLPFVLKDMELSGHLPPSDKEQNARDAAAEAAIRRVKQVQSRSPGEDAEAWAEAAARVIDLYRKRLDHRTARGRDEEHIRAVADAERRLRLDALAAERDELYHLRLTRQIDDTVHRQLVREIDLMETSLSVSRPR